MHCRINDTSLHSLQQVLHYLLSLMQVTAADQIAVIQDVIQAVQTFASGIAGIKRKGCMIGRIKLGIEAPK